MQNLVDKVISALTSDAENKRTSAAYSGSYGDGGASLIELQIKYYNYGRSGALPPEWASFADKVTKESDPEYVEYLRLKARFE